jgi:hypothetical protein
VRVATLPGRIAEYWPCGDCNHNFRQEGYASKGSPDTILAYECMQADSFREIHTRAIGGRVFDVGDGDRDGLGDIICQGRESHIIDDYESVAPDSFPSRLVWQESIFAHQADFARFTDLDRDGHPEITVLWRDTGIAVYANHGDNNYAEVQFLPGAEGQFAVGDFDGDSLTEIAFQAGGLVSVLEVFECDGDNHYVQVCSLAYKNYADSWYEAEAYWIAAANNLEGDGRPDIISMRRRLYNETDSCCIRIFEEPVHDEFVCVCSLMREFDGNYDLAVAAGDVEGDGRNLFAFTASDGIDLMKNTSPGQYEEVWHLDKQAEWIHFFDINGDGRCELIVPADSTYIYEDTSGLGVAETFKPTGVRSIAVEPTVSRRGWPAIFTGIPDGATIEVHNLAGRLVRTQLLQSGPSWTWNLRDQHGDFVPAGTYFAVIRSREKSTSLKLCVVK